MSETPPQSKRKHFWIMLFTSLAFCAIPLVLLMVPRENWVAWRLQSEGYEIHYKWIRFGPNVLYRGGYEITNENFELISQMPRLEIVVFHGTKLGALDLDMLAKLPNLRLVEFDGCFDLRNEEMQKLGNLSIKMILISNTPVADETIRHWEKCPLETLHLRSCDLTDTSIEPISNLSQLTYLDLQNNPGITDAALEHFVKMKRLKVLILNGTSVTKEGVEELRKKHPNTRLGILFEPSTP